MSAPEDTSAGVIRFTMKELLAEIREGITTIKNVQEADGRRIDKIEDEQRQQRETLDRLVPQVTELTTGAKIGAAISEALEERSDRGFTKKEKVAGLLIGLIAIGTNIYALIW